MVIRRSGRRVGGLMDGRAGDPPANPRAGRGTDIRLSSRADLERGIEQALALTRDPGLQVVVVMVVLDGMTGLIDDAGDVTGQAALQVIGDRLAATTGPRGGAHRFSGDGFVLLDVGPAGRSETHAIAGRVLGAVGRPFAAEELSVDGVGLVDRRLTCSIGVAVGTPGSARPGTAGAGRRRRLRGPGPVRRSTSAG